MRSDEGGQKPQSGVSFISGMVGEELLKLMESHSGNAERLKNSIDIIG